MYEQVETQEVAKLDSGVEIHPVATLKDEHGGVAHISIDDGCYVLYLELSGAKKGVCRSTTHIFAEAHAVLKELASPKEREGA